MVVQNFKICHSPIRANRRIVTFFLFCLETWYNCVMPQFYFPKGFYFGASTSAHQVEGGNNNDWTEWEHANSARLAAEAARRHAKAPMRIPDYILNNYPNPLQEENYISGKACDHYNRFREDFDIAKKLGHNAHRFSIEWSRIEPEEGKFNEAEIEHYREVIKALRERGIEPFVTLWHWTNPVWFSERGGWKKKDAKDCFLRYCKKIVSALEDVRFLMILNEPEAPVRHGYIIKDRPPAVGNIVDAYVVLKNLMEAHKEGYTLLKDLRNDLQIGISENLVFFEPYNHLPNNYLGMKLIKWWRNNPFFSRLIRYSDFIGFQYYFHSRIRINPLVSRWGIQFNENKELSDFGWEIYPEGIYHVLKDLKKYGKPIYITENGLADARDEKRAKFIEEHLRWVAKAIKEGVDVRGYFYWSLFDNFEWDKGFWLRFGLVEVDYKTMERKIRQSAWEYAKITKENSIAL